MATLWSRNDALGTREKHTCLERLNLGDVNTMHVSILDKLRNDHARTMIAQTAGMDVGWLEVMTQGKHRQQWSISRFISEIILKLTTCQLRTALRFGSDKLGVLLATQVMTHEWESQSAKVTSATEAGNHLIRIFASHRHLLLCLQSDDGLVQSHMVQNGTQGVLTARSGSGQLHCLGNGSTQ